MQRNLKFSVWFSVVILAAFAVGYLAWAKTNSAWPFDNVFIPYPERGQNNLAEETKGWETYISGEYGFEVRYPEDWSVETQKDFVGFTDPDTKETLTKGEGADIPPYDIQINILENRNNFDLEAYTEKYNNGWFTSYNTKKSLNLSSRPAIKFDDSNSTVNSFPITGVFMSEGNKMFLFTLHWIKDARGNDITDIFNKVLSSFKFIEPDSTTSWKTYRNVELGFEVKYPPNLYVYGEDGNSNGVSIQSSPKEINYGGALSQTDTPDKYVYSGYSFGFGVYTAYNRDLTFDIKEYLKEAYPYSEIDTLTEENISGIKSYRYTFKNEMGVGEPEVIIPYKGKLYFVNYQWWGVKEDEALFNQILSTFKFIQPGSNVQTNAFPKLFSSLTWKEVPTNSSWDETKVIYDNYTFEKDPSKTFWKIVSLDGKGWVAKVSAKTPNQTKVTGDFQKYYILPADDNNSLSGLKNKINADSISGSSQYSIHAPSADGVLGSTWGYLRQNGTFVSLLGVSYHIVDHNPKSSAEGPYEMGCPCDITFRVFESDPVMIFDIPKLAK